MSAPPPAASFPPHSNWSNADSFGARQSVRGQFLKEPRHARGLCPRATTQPPYDTGGKSAVRFHVDNIKLCFLRTSRERCGSAASLSNCSSFRFFCRSSTGSTWDSLRSSAATCARHTEKNRVSNCDEGSTDRSCASVCLYFEDGFLLRFRVCVLALPGARGSNPLPCMLDAR